MGYESEPLHSYHYLSNFSYSIILNNTEFPPTPQFHLTRPGSTISPSCSSRCPLRLGAEFIYGAAGHLFCYGHLLPPNVLPYGVEPRRFHFCHHRGVLPLPAWPTFLRHLCDTLGFPVMGPLQDLEHITHHHPYLTAAQDHRLRHRLIHNTPCPHCFSIQGTCWYIPSTYMWLRRSIQEYMGFPKHIH